MWLLWALLESDASLSSSRKRIDDTIADMEKKQDNQREVLNKLQQQYQKAQVKAAVGKN